MLRPHLKPERRLRRTGFSVVFAMLAALFALVTWAIPFGYPLHGQSVDLPKAQNPVQLVEARRDDALMIAIFRDGKVFLDGDLMFPEILIATLRERVHAGAPRMVYIRADARVRYRAVKGVLDEVHSAGLTNVAFLTEQLKTSQQ